jgi:DNA-binding transcriptional LysR family regulator
MELRQLEYFVAVAEEASFTRAAARVHVAQPGVSAQVRQLERELGQDLLDRSGRTVRLTAVGAAVLPYARAALGAVDGARLAVDELSGLMRGHVTVGMVIACAAVDLPELLADFHLNHPAVEITLSEANSDRLVEALQSGQLDVAIVGLTLVTPAGIELQVIADEPLVAAVSRRDALASRKTITLQGLRGRPLISLPRGTGLRTCLDDACASAGFQPQIAFEATNLNILAQLAGRGLGVAIMAESMVNPHSTELHALAITRPQIRGRLALAWRAEGPVSPAARALIGRARTALARPPANQQSAA